MAKTISFSFLFIVSSTELKETLLSALWFLLHKIGLKGVTSCQFCARSGSDHCLGLYTDLRMSHFSSGSCYSVQFSCSVVSDFLQPHGLQHARPPCLSPTPRACSNSCPSHQWCHPTISSSVVPFSSQCQSFPASGTIPMTRFFASGSQSIGVSASASVLPLNIQDWYPLGWTGWISLQSKGLSRVFSNITVKKGAQLSSQSNSRIHTWPLEKQ